MLQDNTEFAGRHFEVTWMQGEDLPPLDQITQVSSMCFTSVNQIALISTDGKRWNIPGGHPEPKESLEQTLRREVLEEACCEIYDPFLLGWQHVRDIQDNSVHFQMRYFCRIRIQPFDPKHEIRHRKFVRPDEFLAMLSYGHSAIAKEWFKLAMEANAKMGFREDRLPPKHHS